MFHVKQFKAYYTSPYKVSKEVIENVEGWKVNCDAWTLLTSNEYHVNLLAHKWAKYSEFAQKAGNKVKPYKNNLYNGWQVASMKYGVMRNKIDTLLAVTGDLADVTLEEMLSYTLRATRVDLAVTFTLNTPFPDYASQLYDARMLQGENGKTNRKNWSLRQSENGDTLYVGVRGTGKFVRVYDKTFQYTGFNERGYIWRFELEYGVGYADTLWQQMRTEKESDRDIQDYMIRRLWGDMYQRGVALPLQIEAMSTNELRKDKLPSDTDRYLTWMNRTVRPVVQWLIAMGYGEEVSEALGIQQNFMDIIDQDELVQAVIKLTGPEGRASL